MATKSEDHEPTIVGQSQGKPLKQFSRAESEQNFGSLQHLFGPVALIAAACFGAITILLFWRIPGHPTDQLNWVKVNTQLTDPKLLFDSFKPLFDHQLKDYKDGLSKLDAYLGFQAILIATTVLVVIRRSNSLNLFGNSIPLSWLHFFIPILLIYLWLASGFIVHEMVWGRMRGVEIGSLLGEAGAEYKKLFRDAGWIDGWFVSFVDNRGSRNYSGIDRDFAMPTKTLLILVLGTLISAAHASAFALVSIGCRRYLSTRHKRRLFWYYALPFIPLTFLLVSHFLFAYGGPNRNSFQLYVAVVSFPLMALLLWMSAKIDQGSYPETLQCLGRMRQLTLSSAIDAIPLRHNSAPTDNGGERTIALVGDSLSTAFYVSSLPQMFFRARRGWKVNWFLSLPSGDQAGQSVLQSLSALGTVTGINHASVSALVDDAKSRSTIDRLMGTHHFSHQVDEILTGRFPDILLLWIGHNSVDWRSQAETLTQELLAELSDIFARRYEVQLRRLLENALVSDKPAVLVVFGLTNFGSFFQARAEAETMRGADGSLFPHLESAYRYFESMRPEHRDGMIELAILYNDKLETMTKRLGEQLFGTNVRLVYSDVLSVAKMDKAAFLSSIDAWHPSIYGHSRLAADARPTVDEQAQFLGWDTSMAAPASRPPTAPSRPATTSPRGGAPPPSGSWRSRDTY